GSGAVHHLGWQNRAPADAQQPRRSPDQWRAHTSNLLHRGRLAFLQHPRKTQYSSTFGFWIVTAVTELLTVRLRPTVIQEIGERLWANTWTIDDFADASNSVDWECNNRTRRRFIVYST